MTSERMIIDNSIVEQHCHHNDENFLSPDVHPRVTAKKTYFDLHHFRRRKSDDNSETSYHPRIQWTAGTTEIGSSHQTTTYSDYLTRDIMKPILQRESSISDVASTFLPRRNLPPLPDTWGNEPTQPEEIQHLLEPCPIIERPEITQNTAKPKKKFLEKFRKRSNTIIFNSGNTIIPDDTIKPEEEFRLLNESYVRDGIIPIESLSKFESITLPQSDSKNSKPQSTDLRDLSEKKTQLKSPVYARYSDDEEKSLIDSRQDGINKNRKISGQSSVNNKQISIDKNVDKYSNNEETESSNLPLPARRSCEPMSIKNLRKLRESDSQPGPSGIAQKEYQAVDDGKINVSVFPTPSNSIDEPRNNVNEVEIPNSESKESFEEIMKETGCKNDCFKIDNPFSDFSLQTIKQKKSLKQQTIESPKKKMPQRRDSSLPSTSKEAHNMSTYRPKSVFDGRNIEKPGTKTREESLLQSAMYRMKKSLFFDKTKMMKNSQRLLDAIAKKFNLTDMLHVRTEQCGLNQRFGRHLFAAIIRQIASENIILPYILLKTHHDIDREKMIFHYSNHDLQSILAPLMENIVNPNFNNLLINGPNFSYSFHQRPVLVPINTHKNNMWNDMINFFNTACPKAINDILNTSEISKQSNNICSIASLLTQSQNSRKNIISSLVLNRNVDIVSIECTKRIERIIDHFVNVSLSKNLIIGILFLPFSSISARTPNRSNFESSWSYARFYSWQENYRSFPLSLVNYSDEFFYLKKSQSSEWIDCVKEIALALIDNISRMSYN